MRFREERGDIESMFSQVVVPAEDQTVLRTFSVERTPKLSTRRLPVLSPHIWCEVLTDLRELCVAPNGRRQLP